MLVLAIAFGIVVLDQLSKEYVRTALRAGVIEIIPGLFDLRFVQNTGAAWGMFEGFSVWLAVLSVLMLGALVAFRRHLLTTSPLHRVTLALMVGGIIGNMVDRFRLGYVVDFLDFYWRGHHFPAFNVADSAICVGVFMYIASSLLGGDPQEGAEAVDLASQRSSAD